MYKILLSNVLAQVLLLLITAWQTSRVYVHLSNWPVSPTLGWADPVKITAHWKVLSFKASQKTLLINNGLERYEIKALIIDQNIECKIEIRLQGINNG